MKKAKLVLANYDARISKIDINPKNTETKVIFSSRMYNEKTDRSEMIKFCFVDVAAIDFQINYFDNMIGAEAMGLYEITDRKFIEQVYVYIQKLYGMKAVEFFVGKLAIFQIVQKLFYCQRSIFLAS